MQGIYLPMDEEMLRYHQMNPVFPLPALQCREVCVILLRYGAMGEILSPLPPRFKEMDGTSKCSLAGFRHQSSEKGKFPVGQDSLEEFFKCTRSNYSGE